MVIVSEKTRIFAFNHLKQKEMRKLLLLTALALMGSTMQAQNTEYVISGTAPMGSNWVYYFVNGRSRQIDSVAVNQGKFMMKGKQPINTFITVATNARQQLTVVNDRTPITLDLTTYNVTGSAQNIQFANFQKEQKKQTDAMIEIYEKYKKIASDNSAEAEKQKAAYNEQITLLEDAQMKDILQFIKGNKHAVTPAFYLAQTYYSLPYDELVSLLDSTTAYYHHPLMKAAKQQLLSLKKRRPGQQFTDLVMKDTDGKVAKLSQWVGKGNYVLVDFWASWCGPCRMEMPHVVSAYQRYHASKGFDVVGVSFDSKAEAWKKSIKDLGLVWHNISDLQGWRCAAATVYGVNSIPSNILVDPSGKIVAHDLRGDKLAAKLKEIYGE